MHDKRERVRDTDALLVLCRNHRSAGKSLPLWGRWPSAARSDEVVPLQISAYAGYAGAIPWGCASVSFPSRDAEHPARKLAWLLGNAWAAAQTRAGANAAPAPAQGASPLDPFPLARSLGLVESAPLDPFPLARFPGDASSWTIPPDWCIIRGKCSRPEADDHEALRPHRRTPGAQHVRPHS